MTSRLVTVAAFVQPAQAHLAKNVLEAAGIKAAIADEETAGLFWHIAPALSGAKVQVMEEDAERALAVLEKELGPDDGGKVDQDRLAAEAEAAAPEEGVEPPERDPQPAATPEEGAEPPSERDQYARRLYYAAWFSLVVPFLWFYALYLLLNAAFGEGPLGERGRRHLLVGGSILAIGFFVVPLLVLLV